MKSMDVSAEKPKYMGSKRKQSNVEGCGNARITSKVR